MFGGKKKSRNLLASAAAASVGALGGVAATQGTLTFDILATGVSGTGVTLVNNHSVTVTPASVGGTITFDLTVAITGTDTNTRNEGFQFASFRLRSPNTSGGVAFGPLNPANTGYQTTFQLSGVPADPNGGLPLSRADGTPILDGNGDPQPGFSPVTLPAQNNDLDSDGDTDIGGTSTTVDTNNANVRYGSTAFKGTNFDVYRFTMSINSVVNNGAGASTNIAFDRASSAQWLQDNANLSASASSSLINILSGPVITLTGATTTTTTGGSSSVSLGAASHTILSDNTDNNDNNQAVAGSVHITGSQSAGYASEIDGLVGSPAAIGSATVDSAIGTPVYAMLWVLDGTQAPTQSRLDALMADLNAASGGAFTVVDATTAASESQWAGLQAQYGGFNELIRFNGSLAAGAAFNWDFSSQSGLVLDKIAMVPEPATASLLAVPALGLLGRRRRKA